MNTIAYFLYDVIHNMMFDFLLSSFHSNCKSQNSFLYIVTFMLFPSKVISSQNSEFLSNSAHWVNSTDNPPLMDFWRQIDGTGWIEGDSACIVGRDIVATYDWDKMGGYTMPICNHSSGLWNRSQCCRWCKWSDPSIWLEGSGPGCENWTYVWRA